MACGGGRCKSGRGALNHIGVVVDDPAESEKHIKSAGYVTENHANYDPGQRFCFTEENGIEIKVVHSPTP